MTLLHPAGFYVLRRPLLPVDEVFSLLHRTATGHPLEAELLPVFREPVMQEAIYLASPGLYDLLQTWLGGGPVPHREKFLKTMLKYLLRAGTRCTPFGLFAGCTSPGHFASRTALAFRADKPLRKHYRLDAHCAARITGYLIDEPAIRAELCCYPNTSLYPVGDKYYYTCCAPESAARRFTVCSVEASPYLKRILHEAQHGARMVQLAGCISGADVPYPEAEAFVQDLIREQVLVTELEMPVTGPDPLARLLDKLAALPGANVHQEALREVQTLLRQDDVPVKHAFRIKALLQRHFPLLQGESLLHADLHFPMESNTLPDGVIASLTKTLGKLLVLNQRTYQPDLEDFKNRFYERFEEQEVPLLLALDSEAGVGYRTGARPPAGYSPLLEDLSLPDFGPEPATTIRWDAWKEFVLRKYATALAEGAKEIVLTDEDLAALGQPGGKAGSQLPQSFAALGNLIAGSEEALDRGDFMFNLHVVAGPSAVNLLSRFCATDPQLLENVRACVQAEEAGQPDVIFAEVVHLPESRAGNIVQHPVLYRHEIPYLAPSAVDEGHQVAIEDLLVSVWRGREVRLRSRKHGKRVIPRHTTAYNCGRGLPLYKFLCDLQFQECSLNLHWHWNVLEKQLFLPRVRYRNVILSRSTWTLSAERHLPEPGTAAGDAARLAALRTALAMPRYVQMALHDNELLIDFENGHCMALLRDELLKNGTVILKEFLQTPDQCFLPAAGGRCTNEIIIPFEAPAPVIGPAPPAQSGTVRRRFAPGSEWLYLKIYTGEKYADALLKGVVGRLAEELLGEGLIDQWFFVRYRDPHPHVRVRFHGCPPQGFYQATLDRVHQVLSGPLEQGLVHRIQFDTYVREIERYGHSTMELWEHLFFVNSRLVTGFLRLIDADALEQYRWLFALSGIDAVLDDFNYSAADKSRLFKVLEQPYFEEVKGQTQLRKQLREKYAKDLGGTGAFGEVFPASLRDQLHRLLNEYSAGNRLVAGTLATLAGPAGYPLDTVLSNHIHMFINRLFVSHQREHEFVLYHYLYRYYAALVARGNAATGN